MYSVRIHEIPEEGLSLGGEAKTPAWLQRLGYTLKSQAEWGARDSIAARLNVYLGLNENVDIIGEFSFELVIDCDRCLQECVWAQRVPVNIFLTPVSDHYNDGTEDDAAGELSVGSYSNGIIELERILAEQLELNLPMQKLCSEQCAGLCLQCGQNLNESRCACSAG